ncbi:hypothetical protein [Stenotrophomonas sp. 59]|uniref:hypothetical protein n=1 Tax=Stenotrophomonas sp. 59 TaxID=3051120 RepID=UPI00256EBE45|nr:hypothetical protein [Stenotrophomonas sp. 59]
MRRLLLCLLALGMHLPSATAGETAPEDAFSGHLRAMRESNDLALQMLGQQRKDSRTETANVPVDAPPMALLLATWSRDIKRHADPVDGVDSPHLAWALQVLANSRCQPDRSEVWHSLTEDMRVADVYFTCRVGDVERLRHLSEATVFDDSEQSDQRFWKAYLSVLRDGPFHEISGTTRLVSTAREPDWHSEESKHPNDDFSHIRVETDVYGVLIEALIAHPRRLYRTATDDAVAQMTGIMECDDLVQQHRHCMARIAPQELGGARDLARTVSRLSREIPEEALVKECAVLRSRAKALWNDQCE